MFEFPFMTVSFVFIFPLTCEPETGPYQLLMFPNVKENSDIMWGGHWLVSEKLGEGLVYLHLLKNMNKC